MDGQVIARKPQGIKPKSTKTRVISLIVAAVFLVIAYLAPCPEGLTQPGKMAIATLIAGLIVWIFESTPQCVSAMFLMILLYYFGALDLKDIWSKFASSSWFFIMSTFAFTVALRKTTIPTRIVSYLLKISKGKPKGVIFAFLFSPFLLSCFCTNIAATSMFMGIVVSVLESNHCVPGESKLGRCLMMAVPYGAFIGGCTLLCGSSANLTVLALAESSFGFTINFAQWASVGIPLALITLPITWLALYIGYRPEGVSPAVIDEVQDNVKQLGAWSARDKKVAVIIITCLALWISNTWTGIDTAVVGLVGVFLMFLPGMNIMTYKEFANGVSWNVLLVVGSVVVLAAGLSATGANTWIANLVLPLIESAGSVGGMAVESYAMVIIRLLVPSGSAMAGVVVVPLGTIALATGTSLATVLLACAWMSGTTFLLPVDSLMLIPYSFGWSSMTETLRVGWIPALVIATYSFTIAPLILSLWGL